MPLNGLPEKDLRDHCRRAIENLESWLRRLIHDEFRGSYGESYLDAKSPNGIDFIVSRKLANPMLGRQSAEPARYARPIDAALLENLIDLICNPELYPKHFRQPLVEVFPVGREQALAVLVKLVSPRNALSHAGPLSVRQAEQIICYSGDVISSLKSFYASKNMGSEFNVPSIIKFSDSFGNVFHSSQFEEGGAGLRFVLTKEKTFGDLRVGETLSMEVEIDPTFARGEYFVSWPTSGHGSIQNAAGMNSTKFVLAIDERCVMENFLISVIIRTGRPWHRWGDYDDMFAASYRVLPPGS